MTDTTIQQKNGKILSGVVVKTAMKDTVTVAVDRYVMHPKYKKYQRLTKKFLVHNPGNTVAIGDTVEIRETRPISKLKHFEIVSASVNAEGEAKQ